MTFTRNAFDNGAALAEALADRVADTLSAAIAARGSASLAVSGGSTPKAFFNALSGHGIDWSKVAITLVDERFVPADNPRSNHLLVKENLLKGPAAKANFIPLYRDASDAEAAAAISTKATANICSPFDVAILGMGNDGHTASFFPDGDNLADAIDSARARGILTMEAAGAGEKRLTFSFSALSDARLLVLHIEGAEKAATLEKALQDGPEEDMPIRAVLRRAESPVEIYWAP
ncbi:6-phosphogluconolactonase [Rhizobium sp. L1K21]|uniref:6-phosphogluconolactonase n=1 Tax=Rhizobium sp. L1K21 TaxID=2954933 RepID=UPI0020930F2E|nr:6-phosphogluconolactonase [Rhizobium sp. L1K21]MCO6187091.1 6-phosphogluconolactonase [Rhizobium sp. L1K21]